MIIQIGKLEGLFMGFHDRDSLFRFTDGTVWRQVEDKRFSAHCFEPTARVVAHLGTCFLEVEGLTEWVQVSREHACDEP